jgi:hypothetical protein
MEEAVKKEINKQYVDATICYENDIKNNPKVSVDSYINLAFIYWSFVVGNLDFDIPIPEGYSIDIDGYKKILELGFKKYPNNIELHFWKKYFSGIFEGEEFSEKDCLDLIEKYNEQNYVPYFFLYLFDKKKYKKQRDELMKEVGKMATAKNFYIETVVRGEDNRED